MQTKNTQIITILDRSGSMSDLEADTIGGYNTFIKKQQKVEGKAYLTTVLFDDEFEILHDMVDIKEVLPLTGKEYFARGCTALNDAVGMTISRMANKFYSLGKESQPDSVIVLIVTDGYENASHEYSREKVAEMIETQKEKNGWEFIFMGANIDATATANCMNIEEDSVVDLKESSDGQHEAYYRMNQAVMYSRGISESRWHDDEEDSAEKADFYCEQDDDDDDKEE